MKGVGGKDRLACLGGKPVRPEPMPPAFPLFTKDEYTYISKVLDSHYIAEGEFTKRLEDKFSEFVGSKFCIATSCGTSALHLALLALGVKGGDEVITTPYTFISTSNACLYVGSRPVFVDIDPRTFTINVDKIEEKITDKTKAILPVHVWGHPCNMKKIMKIAEDRGLFVIEDASHAFGAKFDGRHVGTFGHIGCFSLYATKTITSAMGGLATTDNKELCDKINLLKKEGDAGRYEHTVVGYNYRTSDVHSAIGLAQLKKINRFICSHIENATQLTKLLSEFEDYIELPVVAKNCKHAFYYYAILLKPRLLAKISRAEFDRMLRAENIIPTSYYSKPLHLQKAYEFMHYKKGEFPVAEDVCARSITLPVHQALGRRDMMDIYKAIKKIISYAESKA
jgi:dTDP-4-amino-4,6-dideoxygalactose transaminase